VLLATVIVVPARWAAAAPATQRDAAERIAEILEAQHSEQHIPGFAFALVRKDRLELVIVRGVRAAAGQSSGARSCRQHRVHGP
jgi:CubicO group peptidase (beta-lactamase class C family)